MEKRAEGEDITVTYEKRLAFRINFLSIYNELDSEDNLLNNRCASKFNT
jgi:hypothetical protein